MTRNQLAVKVLILVAVCGYFAYTLYWFVREIPWVVVISLRPGYDYLPIPGDLRFINSYSVSIAYLMDYSAFFGLMIRFVGASFALFSALLILKTKTNSFIVIRDKVSVALLLEGLYFLSFIPGIYYLLDLAIIAQYASTLASAFLAIQILLISPFLISLSLKVRKYKPGMGGSSLIGLAVLSSMNYVIALWLSYILKWIEVSFEMHGFWWFLSPFSVLGFLNTVIVLSLAVVFAVGGSLHILRKDGGDNAMRWWGLSAIFFSTYIVIYVIYCVSVRLYWMIPFGELWAIPIIGLGIYLLLKNPKVRRAEKAKTITMLAR